MASKANVCKPSDHYREDLLTSYCLEDSFSPLPHGCWFSLGCALTSVCQWMWYRLSSGICQEKNKALVVYGPLNKWHHSLHELYLHPRGKLSRDYHVCGCVREKQAHVRHGVWGMVPHMLLW